MRRPWTAAERARLRQLYPNATGAEVARALVRSVSSVWSQAKNLGLAKSAQFLASQASGRSQRGRLHPRMMAHQFQPGQAAWNKGKKMPDNPRSQATQFKRGERPHNTLPVGSYRINKDGHLQRKVAEASGSNSQRWRGVAELVWTQAHGPLPPGHIVVFRPGRFSRELENITLDAVECISRAEHARRNHPRNKSPELGRLVQLKGAITRQVNRINREATQA